MTESRTPGPRERTSADLTDRYDRMTQLAGLFDESGGLMRARAALGARMLHDPAFLDSAELSGATAARAEEDIRSATTGRHGLANSATELDADAVVLRATVQTYRWIDALQVAAYQTLGAIAGRAVGYFAPQVELGGELVSAGLIETDDLDREGVGAYLNELAASNPELLEHVSGGGGLLGGLPMRSLLTVGFLSSESAGAAGAGGLRACGVAPMTTDFASALRDVAGGLLREPDAGIEPAASTSSAGSIVPTGLAGLMAALDACASSVTVDQVGPNRFIAYLPGPDVGTTARLRLVDGDPTAYADRVVRAIEAALLASDVGGTAYLMLVGRGLGGAAAARIASQVPSERWAIEQVVTAGAPSASAPRLPDSTRMLSLEDRADPVAMLGSLINAGAANRLSVVVDTGSDSGGDYVTGAGAADAADHPELQAELERLRGLGYLARSSGPSY